MGNVTTRSWVLVGGLTAAVLAGVWATSTHADERMDARIGNAIASTRRDVGNQLSAAAVALRRGNGVEARARIMRAARALRSGTRACWLVLGAKPPEMPKLDPSKFPGPAPDATKPKPTPTQEQPDPAITQRYDRFTGEAHVAVAAAEITGRHRRTRKPAKFVMRFHAGRVDGGADSYGFEFGTDDAPLAGTALLRRNETITVYFLIDGERARHTARAVRGTLPKAPMQVVGIWFVPTELQKILRAKKVEMRLGDYEMELPASYRAKARKAVDILAKLPR